MKSTPDRIRLLVVDDEALMLEFLSLVIPPERYDISFCQNGRSALATFMAERFDLVLSDCNMPEMCGEALAREIHEQSTGTPVVLMSGHDIAPIDIPSVVAFLKKPFRAAQLCALLETLCA